MIKYVRKEDQYCKYFVRYNIETKEALAIYRNKDGKRWGINFFQCFPTIYDSNSEYIPITMDEFNSKLEIALKWIN